jgi:hypothetical protein
VCGRGRLEYLLGKMEIDHLVLAAQATEQYRRLNG